MSENINNFDETDLKIAAALERKGLKVPTGSIENDEVPEGLPLPESLQDSTALAMRIIGMAEGEKQDKILPFKKPTELPEEARAFAMAARKGKALSAASEAKIQAVRERIKKSRGK